MRVKFYIAISILLLASSCGQYEKLLKSTDFELKKAKAKEYYDARQYTKSSELLSQILPRYRATEEAEELNWMNSMSYYGMKDYYSAGGYFESFIDQFPFGVHTEEASYMAPYCNYKIAPRSELDQESTLNAIEGFKIFLIKYPASAKAEECKTLIKELEEKLVEKSYLSARLYYDMKQYKAAVTALNNSLKEYTESKFREEMMYLKLNSLFQFAELSTEAKQKERYQATLDDYFSFMEEFPKSNYSKDVKNIFEKTNKYLKAGIPDSGVNNQ